MCYCQRRSAFKTMRLPLDVTSEAAWQSSSQVCMPAGRPARFATLATAVGSPAGAGGLSTGTMPGQRLPAGNTASPGGCHGAHRRGAAARARCPAHAWLGRQASPAAFRWGRHNVPFQGCKWGSVGHMHFSRRLQLLQWTAFSLLTHTALSGACSHCDCPAP